MEQTLGNIAPGAQLLLHSCCGPCSSAVLERLTQHFTVTLLYYNPNIWPAQEYTRRMQEQKKLLQKLPAQYPVYFEEIVYNHQEFLDVCTGLQAEPEGGKRCEACFVLRLKKAAEFAAQNGIGWLTTTLTVSPHKNAHLLNQVGAKAVAEYGIQFLPSDFKKKNGYKRSLELSALYGLYRQQYCGCEFSQRQSLQQGKGQAEEPGKP